MTNRLIIHTGWILLALTTSLLACQDEADPPTLRNLDRPEDVAFLCTRYSGSSVEVETLEGCEDRTGFDILAFVSQSARSEIGIYRLGDNAGIIDVETRIPLPNGIEVAPLPSAMFANDGGRFVYIAHRDSGQISVLPVGLAYSLGNSEIVEIPLTAPAHTITAAPPEIEIIDGSTKLVTTLYVSLPSRGEIAVFEVTETLDAEAPAFDFTEGEPIIIGSVENGTPSDGDGDADVDGDADGDSDADGDADLDADEELDADEVLDADDVPDADGEGGSTVARVGDIEVVGNILYVAVENGDFIAVVDTELSTVERLSLGYSVVRMAHVPIATGNHPDRSGPWLYAVEKDRGNIIVVDLSVGQLIDLSIDDPLSEDPRLSIPGVAQDVAAVEIYPEICENDIDDDNDGEVDESGDCQDADTDWVNAPPVGVYAFVTSSNGSLYVITIQDEYSDYFTGEGPLCVNSGTNEYNPDALGCKRHYFRPGDNVNSLIPSVDEAPDLVFDEVNIPLTDLEPDPEYPSMEGHTVERTHSYQTDDGEETETFFTYGLFFNWSNIEYSRNEAWAMIFEGVIPGTARQSGNIEPSNIFRDRSGGFCGTGVCGSTDCGDYEGDRLIIKSQPSPPDETIDCTAFEFDEEESLGLEYRIVQATDAELTIETVGSTPMPSLECFPYAVEYEIRTRNQWMLIGETTGFLHQRTTAEDGTCEYEPHVESCGEITCDTSENLSNDPLNRTAFTGDPKCLINGRVTEGEDFANPFFCFVLNSGICNNRTDEICQSPDTAWPSVRGSAMSWTSQGGYRGIRVDTGDLPGAIRFNQGDRGLYIVDRSDLGLVEVQLNNLSVVRNFY